MPKRKRQCDAEGWATRYGVLCEDGVTLMQGAFSDSDGCRVPLLYQHNHTSPDAVIGYADLEARPEGIYTYLTFDKTSRAGKEALRGIAHGLITSLSIFANRLQKAGNNVMHGVIREVSVVLAGCNPEAKITYPQLAHGAIAFEDDATECIIHSVRLNGTDVDDDEEEMMHMAKHTRDEYYGDEEYTAEDLMHDLGTSKAELIERGLEKMDPAERAAFEGFIGEMAEAIEGSDDDDEEEDDNSGYDETDTEEEEVEHSAMERINVWDRWQDNPASLTHGMVPFSREEQQSLMADALACRSFKQAALAHGITNLDIMFPEASNINGRTPEMLNLDIDWCEKILTGASKHGSFRIRTVVADISTDEARALGYITGNRKKEEMFALFKRSTQAQTIIKKQSLDRDTKLDLESFDVVMMLWQEMRIKLREEAAKAILLGDGREMDSEDKILEDRIHPIVSDDDLFTIKAVLPVSGADTIKTQREAIIDMANLSRIKYRGSGNPLLFSDPSTIRNLLMSKDLNGHRLYKTRQELATAMDVREIIEVPHMEGKMVNSKLVGGIIVNPSDYTIGQARGGEITKFEDFDIDFNRYKYLLETRMSGMLRKPYSAITLLYPENVTPQWYVSGATGYITSDLNNAMTQGATPLITYAKASPSKKDNPRDCGWFERSGAGTEQSPYVYTETSDTKPENVPNSDPVVAKDYYVRRVEYVSRNA